MEDEAGHLLTHLSPLFNAPIYRQSLHQQSLLDTLLHPSQLLDINANVLPNPPPMPLYISVSVTLLLVYRAYTRKSLTTGGIVAAVLTAIAHAIHPWSVGFILLVSFYAAGTYVTRVKREYKAGLTASAVPAASHARTATQVLCNSLPASVLLLVHAWHLRTSAFAVSTLSDDPLQSIEEVFAVPNCLSHRPVLWLDVLPFGVLGMYAAVAADTFSSELGILSSDTPVLITGVGGWLKGRPIRVPRGTNGGVTAYGVLAGLGGAALMAVITMSITPFCGEMDIVTSLEESWTWQRALIFGLAMAMWGACGSLLDSFLGGWLQASVIDSKSGKVVEGYGGQRVVVDAPRTSERDGRPETPTKATRRIISGRDILSNNGINLLMATLMCVGAILGTGLILR